MSPGVSTQHAPTNGGRTSALRLNVTLQNGAQFSPRAVAGRRIADLINADGFPLGSGCRDGCGCSSCHIKVRAPWKALLPPPSDQERESLRRLPNTDDRSRLACQLKMTVELDGLVVELQPESIAPQTYWVAG